jgi:hypothetical protein
MNMSDKAVKPSAATDSAPERHTLVHPSWVTFVRFCRSAEPRYDEADSFTLKDPYRSACLVDEFAYAIPRCELTRAAHLRASPTTDAVSV